MKTPSHWTTGSFSCVGSHDWAQTVGCLFAVGLLFSVAYRAEADPLDTWNWRNPLPTGNTLRAVTYGANTFVAVGDHGTIVSSPDGMRWTQQPSGLTNALAGVAYGNGAFVVVGGLNRGDNNTNVVLTSTNGQTWTLRNSGSTNLLLSIAFGNGVFVAVGTTVSPPTDTILTSLDGIHWTARDTGTFGELHGVTFGNGLFVAVGPSSWIVTSRDGIKWTMQSNGNPANLNGVAYGGGLFVAVGNGANILTSPNGTTWTTQTSSVDQTYTFQAVAYGQGRFAAVGGVISGVASLGGVIATSADGVHWTQRLTLNTDVLFGVVASPKGFCAVGNHDALWLSSDATTWTPWRVGPTLALRDLTYGGGRYVAVGGEVTGFTNATALTANVVLSSTDATNWVASYPNTSEILNGVTYGNGLYIAVGSSGSILTSTDSRNWARQDGADKTSLAGVAYGNGTFIAVGSGSIQSSTTGLQWASRAGGEFTALNAVTFGPGVFVTVGANSVILTSPDGVNWRLQDPGVTDAINLTGIAYGNGLFVAVGFDPFVLNASGAVLTSPDGVKWTPQNSGFPEALTGVAFVNRTFAATGGQTAFPGAILTSTNGIVWTRRESGTVNLLNHVQAALGTFLAVGSDGTILQSGQIPLIGPPLQFVPGTFQRLANGTVRATLHTEIAGLLTVEAGTNFQTWSAVTNFQVQPGGSYHLTDKPAPAMPRRFYRARIAIP